MAENFNNSVTLEKLFNLMNAVPEKKRQDLVNRAYEAIKPRIAEIIEEYKEFYVFFEQLKAFCISTGENYAVSMPNDIDFNKAKSDGEHDEALVVVEEKQKEETAKTEQAPSKDSVEDEKHEEDDTKPENKDNDIDFNKAKSDGEPDEALVEEQPQPEGSEKTEQTEPNTPEPSEDGKDSDGNSQKESEVKNEEPDTSDKQKQEELLRKLQELAHQNSAATGIPYEDCLEFLSKKTNIKAVA